MSNYLFFRLGIAIRLAVGLAVLLTFTLQFFVCLETVWNMTKKFYGNNAGKANIILRISLTVGARKFSTFF